MMRVRDFQPLPIVSSGAILGAIAIAIIGAGAAPAMAQGGQFGQGRLVEEIRFGVMNHDINPTGGPGKEDGVDYQLEIIFGAPDVFRYILSPRPYIQYSLNSAGDTDFWSFGLGWQQSFADRFYGELAGGLANHDGVRNLPPDPGDPTRLRLDDERIIFGSRWLFRGSAALGFQVTPRIDVAIVYEHLSHGQVFGDGKNEALDTAGLRAGFKF